MVSQLGDNANDGGIGALTSMVTNLQNDLNNLSSQLGNYDTSTLEGSQAIGALNNRISVYQNAIQQYTDLINEIKGAASEARRGSGIKQQTKQGYITGLSTKRGMTHAEAMKDMADIEATGRAERAEVRGQEQENLASARGGLATTYMNIAEQEASIEAAKAAAAGSGSGGSSSGGLTSALNDYTNIGKDVTVDDVNAVVGNPTTTTTEIPTQQNTVIKKKPTGKFWNTTGGNIIKYIVNPSMIGQYNALNNIFKKLTNK